MMEARWEQLRASLELARTDSLEEVDSDAEFDLLANAHIDAKDRLLAAQAPDMQALAYKLEVFRDEEAYNLVEDAVHEILNGIIADVRRLVATGHA